MCAILFPKPELEAKAVAALILARYKKEFPARLFGQVKEWLAKNYLDNWASVDTFCPEIMGTLLLAYPALVREIRTWPKHPNRWVKRASIVSFLKLTKKEGFPDIIYEQAIKLFPVDDDLIHKANGWVLARSRQARHAEAGEISPQARPGHSAHHPALRHRTLPGSPAPRAAAGDQGKEQIKFFARKSDFSNFPGGSAPASGASSWPVSCAAGARKGKKSNRNSTAKESAIRFGQKRTFPRRSTLRDQTQNVFRRDPAVGHQGNCRP